MVVNPQPPVGGKYVLQIILENMANSKNFYNLNSKAVKRAWVRGSVYELSVTIIRKTMGGALEVEARALFWSVREAFCY